MSTTKPVHSLVLDAGPIIKNEPPVSTLLSQAEKLFTVPAIISEIKDAQTRSRVQTTLQPFLTIQSPRPSSIKTITDFARRTGDLGVLSRPDIEIIALTYDLECERNHGDWRLRSMPGQKGMNGKPPSKQIPALVDTSSSASALPAAPDSRQDAVPQLSSEASEEYMTVNELSSSLTDNADPSVALGSALESVLQQDSSNIDMPNSEVAEQALSLEVSDDSAIDVSGLAIKDDAGSDSDSEGWITPSNLKQQQAKDLAGSTDETSEQSVLQAAVLTSDFAMQNVLLQMNLNLLSSNLQRVKQLKTFVLRCHACFLTVKDMSKQFCPRCGQPALTRVACSTNARGEFKLHLKKNMQWNTRGDRYSVPKPAHGSANGRVSGGGKGGWGHDLILAEDQKEYERARVVEKKQKERSLMDDDYLPSILTGDRTRGGGRIKVGAGKNINARKR